MVMGWKCCKITKDLGTSLKQVTAESSHGPTVEWWHLTLGGVVIAIGLAAAASYAKFVKPALNYVGTSSSPTTYEVGAASSSPTSPIVVHDYQLRSFSAHMLNYLSIGFISGGIVHVQLFDKDKNIYAAHLCIGVIVYLFRFLIISRFQINSDMLKFLGVSVFVSLGTGMVNGSLQHFQDNPKIGSVLMPIGFVIVYISFVARNRMEELATGKATKDAEGLVMVSAKELAELRAFKEQHQGQQEEISQQAPTSIAKSRTLSWRSIVLALTVAAALFGISYGIATYIEDQRGDDGGH